MRGRKDMRGPGPESIRWIFIIIAQLQHYLSTLMPPCLLRSPTSASRSGTPNLPTPPHCPPSPPPQLFQVTVITNHDNHSDPWSRLITVVLSLVQTPQCLLCPVWRGGLGTPALISYWSLRKYHQNHPTQGRREGGGRREELNQSWETRIDNKHGRINKSLPIKYDVGVGVGYHGMV